MPWKKKSDPDDASSFSNIDERIARNPLDSLSIEVPNLDIESYDSFSSGPNSTSPLSEVSDSFNGSTRTCSRISGTSDSSCYEEDHRSFICQKKPESIKTSRILVPKKGGPGFQGFQGKPINVFANHFPLKIKTKCLVNHYDVQVTAPWKRETRKTDERLFRKAFRQLCLENRDVFPKCCAYDGSKNFYTTRRLGFYGKNWTGKVTLPEFEDNDTKDITLCFEVQLARSNINIASAIKAFINGCSDDATSETQILNIVLSQSARENCVSISGNYFPQCSQPGRVVDLPCGKSVWFGFFQAVNIGWKPMLNIDVANKPAVKGCDFINYMETVLGSQQQKINFRASKGKNWNNDLHRQKLERDIKGLKIRYVRPDKQKREWRCNSVLDNPRHLKFNHEGTLMSVEEYFLTTYNYKLKYPLLPCIHLGSTEKTFFIPVELCEMKTQPIPQCKKLTDDETAHMIRKTAVTPKERKERIENSLRNISNTFKDDEYAKEFGLSVEGIMSQIQARVYDSPQLAYKELSMSENIQNFQNISPSIVPFKIPKPGGKWDMTKGMKGSKLGFIDNRHLKNWSILDLADLKKEDVGAFVNALYEEGDKIGYRVEYASEILKANIKSMHSIYQAFQKLCTKRPDMIIVFTRGKNAAVYNGLKYEGDIVQRISTQFVQQKNIGTKKLTAKPATLHNILLKINSKLGGTNQMLHTSNIPSILQRPVIIMGADVTHPSSDFKHTKPSIAAIVGSMDAKASQYLCEIRLQKMGQVEEMISTMEEVTRKLLIQFRNKNMGRKPEKIIFYRDGVSEGQFLIVLNKELAAIRRACLNLEENYNPPITYIVAQKRHKTRLFPVTSKDGVGKNQNVPPGTVVDHTITHPTEFSFFLASHEGIQGTTKPTNYHLLWDDTNMKPDDIIKMTYYLCHTYARCERSVSYPAPTYYAHLAAFRARVHHDALVDTNRDTAYNRARLEEEISLTNYFM